MCILPFISDAIITFLRMLFWASKVRLVGFTFCVLTPVVLVSQATQLCPGDELCFGCKETEAVRYRVKMVHQSVVEQLSSNSSVSGDGLLNGDGRHSDPDRELIAA